MLCGTPFIAQIRPFVLAVAAGIGACGGRTEDVPAPLADAGDARPSIVPDAIGPEASDSADANSCVTVLASDYDQSCSLDADCVAVPQKPDCQPTCWNCFFSEAINKNAFPQYYMALLQAFASEGPPCNCPAEGIEPACCRNGTCQTACSTAADVLPACAAMRGECLYNEISHPVSCGWLGPPNSCAYPDEICCRSLH